MQQLGVLLPAPLLEPLLDQREALAFMSEEWFKEGLVDDEGHGLCAVTAVDGAFVDFVPAFVFSLHRSHPRSLAIVLSAKPLPSHIRDVLATSGLPPQSYRLIVDHRLENLTGSTAHSKLREGSSKMAAARFLGIEPLAGNGCRWVYYSDVDMFFFRSPATENKTIVRWHAERMARTRRGPFDNVLRPETSFFGCGTPSGERLTGLHFVAWKPWVQLVGPCMRKASRTLASHGVSDWCSAKHGFLDEHLLWLSTRLCGLDPGPRMTRATLSQERPVHGYHAHSRQLEHPSDLSSVCDVALPFAQRYLGGLALSRFEGSARVVGCTQKPGGSEGHSWKPSYELDLKQLPIANQQQRFSWDALNVTNDTSCGAEKCYFQGEREGEGWILARFVRKRNQERNAHFAQWSRAWAFAEELRADFGVDHLMRGAPFLANLTREQATSMNARMHKVLGERTLTLALC